jgi:hypothetical protein
MKQDPIDPPPTNRDVPTARMRRAAEVIDADAEAPEQPIGESNAVDIQPVLSVEDDSSFSIGARESE